MLRSTTYTVAEVAELLQCTSETVRGYVASGKLLAAPRLSSSGPWRIPSSEVERLTEGTGMSARFDDKRGQWFCDFWYHYPDGRRERFRLDAPVNTRQGALQHERQTRNAIADGTYRRTEALTLRQFAREFSTWAANNLKPSTSQTYDKILRNNLLPFLGALKLACITPEWVERYKAERVSKGASPKTVSNELLCLSSLLRLAVEFGHLSHAPKIRRPKLPRAQDRAYRWLTQAEADKLLAVDSSYRTMMVVALNTGLRLGELQALAWDQVDLKAKRLVVSRNYAGDVVGTPKGGRNRVVPLNAQVLDALGAHLRRLHCDLVFNTATGRMVSQSDASKGLWRACDTAGVERFGWHVLRHTFASWLVQRGVTLRAVQELLGHATITVTERYAHLSPDVSSEAVRALDRCIRGL